ncbi:hypothetical protein Acr_14g0002420 [Actinidia rufa]|uniref:Uncharacterized protein n=1 Tax=Actinidia rufa TaxID=165716 RepID=A0A7J0FQE4_9ERIC|nr:hypothetical protein Acr_14g0002420 [Actinidia rufa]
MHPTRAKRRRQLDFTRHVPLRAQKLAHSPARALRRVQQPARASTRANAPSRARRVAATRSHAPARARRLATTGRHAPTHPAEPLTRAAAALSRANPRRSTSLDQQRDYSSGTNERVPEATGRGQKKRPEKRSQEGGHRGQEKRRDKKNCPRNKAQDQSSEVATTAMMAVDESDVLLAASADEEDLYGWQTTQRRIVGKGTVRFRMADGRSMKVTGIRHVSLRCKIRSDETLKLVEEYSEFPRETRNAARERKLKGYTDWRGVSRQEELLSDIGPMSDTGAQEDALGYVQKSGQKREGATSAGCPWRSSEEKDRVNERWSHDDLQSDVLCSAPRWRGAGHLSEKLQALRFGSAFTSVEVELPVEEGVTYLRYYLADLIGELDQKLSGWIT